MNLNNRNKYKHLWFAENLLQKATGLKAQEVKRLLQKDNVQYKVNLTVVIRDGRIICFDNVVLAEK